MRKKHSLAALSNNSPCLFQELICPAFSAAGKTMIITNDNKPDKRDKCADEILFCRSFSSSLAGQKSAENNFQVAKYNLVKK